MTDGRSATAAEGAPVLVHLRPALDLTDEQLFVICQLNQALRIERTAEGDLVVMPPAGGDTGNRNATLTTLLTSWAWRDGRGAAFDSSTGFVLPNGAMRSPDAAWVLKARLQTLSAEQRQKFLPLCPDFVAELRSPSERLINLQDKMQEYIANGTHLAWLIDPLNRCLDVYRPGSTVERLEHPSTVSGEPILPAFILDLHRAWTPDL